MGLAGGLVPSPTALVVLLSAAAVGRAWFGVLLVIAFGIGMAATLAATGLLVVAAGDRLARFAARGRFPRIARIAVLLPLLTATGVCVLGAAIVLKALPAIMP
jgi:ABC-type nickel/cobalt efflux system permease component RcnA